MAKVTGSEQGAKPRIVHDSEYYILEMQRREQWTADDHEIDLKLADLRKKHGTLGNPVEDERDSGLKPNTIPL